MTLSVDVKNSCCGDGVSSIFLAVMRCALNFFAVLRCRGFPHVPLVKVADEVIAAWGPFLESSENFSGPKSHS